MSIRNWMAFAVALGVAACNKTPNENRRPAEHDKTTKPDERDKMTEAPAKADDAIVQLFAAYETARALLAQDRADGVADAARQAERAASAAVTAATPATLPHLEAARAAAAALAAAPVDDVEAARRAFGDLSKPLVELVAAEPALATGRHVFECPMAQGYQKWIQPTEKLENPYMGTQMLACGGASEWR